MGLADRHGDGFPDFLVGSAGTAFHLGQLDWFDGAPLGVRAFGEPCSRIRGVTPCIGASGTPRLGRDYELHLSQVPAGQKAVLLVGFSSSSWKGLGLPLDLGFLGLSGCQLLVSPEARYAAAAEPAGGTDAAATVRLSLRADMALLNQPLYAQWLLHGPGGGAVTRALELIPEMPERAGSSAPR